jgi:16S rRNA (guanine966-N2)-methyltransferase
MPVRSGPTIIAGEWRRKRLTVPPGWTVRPTRGRIRGALFDMLGEAVVGARALDLFAGAGVLGLEALSRGAASCLFVERDRSALAALRKNIATCGPPAGRATVLAMDADSLRLPLGPFDLVLLDPPFARLRPLPEALVTPALTTPAAVLTLHAPADRPCPSHIGPWRLDRERTHGRSTLALYHLDPPVPAPEVG